MKDKANLEGNEFEYSTTGGASLDKEDPKEVDWLGIAKAAAESSTDFLDANYRAQFEKNLANFKSKHPPGSKYYSEMYKTRSRLFRPKTRTAVRKNEAAFAAAMFTAMDTVVCEAEDADDPKKRVDAAYWNEVLNYRLDKTIPWFKTSVGAIQEAMIYGAVVSKQYWEYEEAVSDRLYPVMDPIDQSKFALDEQGQPIFRPELDVVKDRPKIKLIEIENIRFDGACDWTDPINSSPYLIEYIPMYLQDVRDKMTDIDEETGEPVWAPLEDAQILAMGKEADKEEDTTKKARNDEKSAQEHTVSDFEIVWVHENIVRKNGREWVYFTLGTQHMLTQPEPLEAVYRTKYRPYVAGNVVIEAHRPIPSGTVELGEHLQAEANDLVNQRLDNVKLVLNQRKYVDRNADVDLYTLMRSIPGGITLTNDVNAIVPEKVQDVTGSAYNEQNRLDTDYDDIAGVFTSGSVANNRNLNETVGGMEKMSEFANQDTEYLIRTFVETWVEPVLYQIVDLEQMFEDDNHIKDIASKAVVKSEQQAAERAGAPGGVTPEGAPQPDQQQVAQTIEPEISTDNIPSGEHQNIDIRVNVGFGSLSPEKRIRRVTEGLRVMGEIAPWSMMNLDVEEVAKDVFGALGHKNGHKFFSSFEKPQQQEDPEVAKAKAEMQLKQDELELKQTEIAQNGQLKQQELAIKRELGYAEIALKENISLQQLQTKLGIEEMKIQSGAGKEQLSREIAGANNLTKLAEVERKENELQFKKDTGRQGI